MRLRNFCLMVFCGFTLCLIGSVSATPAEGPSAERMLARMDSDGDGRIAKEEWLGQPHVFRNFDLNKDGVLTRDEIDIFLDHRRKNSPSGQSENSQKIDWIDVHVHPAAGAKNADYSGVVQDIAKTIDESAMVGAVLMPTPQNAARWRLEDFLNEAKNYSGRLAFLGGGGTLNPMIHEEARDGVVSSELAQRFRRRAEEILALGAVGFGEIAGLHLSFSFDHPFESVPADHPLLLLLADIAADHDVVIDFHNELIVKDIKTPDWLTSPANPPSLIKNIDGLERLLDHNIKAKIIWAHAGSDNIGHWTVDVSRRLLTAHPNLYMSLRMGAGQGDATAKMNHPIGAGGILRPEWRQLLTDFPDRFVIGGDQFFTAPFSSGAASRYSGYAEKIRRRTDHFLTLLPPQVARKIGYENAIALYKLNR